MHRRKLTVLALAAVAVAAVGLTGASAGTGQHGRFQMIAGGQLSLSSKFAPTALSSKPVTYILEMAAKPVAVVSAAHQAAGRGPLSTSQRAALTRHISSLQAPVAASVLRIHGATVNSRFQGVYNGMSVTLAQRDAWKLSSIPGVKAVYATHTYKMDTAPGNGIPLVKGPETWGGLGAYNGNGMKIGVIDTGIDYTHADFGGTGTPAAYSCAHAHETEDAATFATSCPGVSNWYSGTKVKGGIDLVGDSYNAASGAGYQPVPHPDTNPLDCNGHGSHVAGTATGFGVTGAGATYAGSYNATTISSGSFNIPPGVAPKASLYGIRVFGCAGSVNDDILVDAYNWAFNNGMDVVNLSLGSSFGSPDDASSIAADNLAASGVIVVFSSGNSGPRPYMTGSPAAGLGTISTASNDPTASYPGADLTLTKADTTPGGVLSAIVANGATVTPGTYSLKVLYSNAPTNTVISNGCRKADGTNQLPDNSLPANTILVIARGTCARVAKAIFAQQMGAVGAIMVNNSTGLPPYEGPITADPDAAGPPLWGGFQYSVTIPFFGVTGGSNPSNSANGVSLRNANGGTVAVAGNAGIANPAYLALSSFTSFGPAGGGLAKPEVTAPGSSIISAGNGTGNGGVFLSGTSMASPHDAGTAVLVKQAHPSWGSTNFYKDAIVNTANPALVSNFSVRGAGAGEIDAYNATHTRCVAEGSTGTTALSFGVVDMTTHYTGTATITLTNFTSSACDFQMSVTRKSGVTHSVRVFSGNTNAPLKIRVPANGTKTVSFQIDVLKTNAKDPVAGWHSCFDTATCTFNDAAGLVHFKAINNSNHGIGLNVPYYAVPTLVSNVKVSGISSAALANGATDGNVVLTNPNGGIGYADWFSWGGTEGTEASDVGSADLLNAGIQSYPVDGYLVFALQTSKSWSNPAADEFDIYVDVNNDSVDDYVVVSADFGALTGGTVTGEAVTAVFPLAAGGGTINFDTQAMFTGTTMELPVLFSQLCVASNPCLSSGTAIKYHVVSFDRNGGSDTMTGISSFNAYHPSLSTANNSFDVVHRNSVVPDPVTIDDAAWTANPQLGILVLAQNNQNTVGEALTFALSF